MSLFYHRSPEVHDPRRITKRRVSLLSLICGAVILAVLVRIFSLQVFAYRYYENKVLEEITAGSKLKAERGTIYDANGIPLATNKTAWRIYIAPHEIKRKTRSDGIDYASIISAGLSRILSVSQETVHKKALAASHMDETIKRKASAAEKDLVLSFIIQNDLSDMVFAEATTTRYYPFGNFASHLLGFTGSDNQGLFGIEAYYDSLLTGTDGQYLTVRDATGKILENGYSGYIEPIPGLSITTTIDAYIQRELEAQLALAMNAGDAQNRVTGIAMNVHNGAILAMATLSPYNPNSPYTLDEDSLAELLSSGYGESDTEYKNLKSQLLYEMWNNKAVSELYEPGSTFKIITCAAALATGVVSPNETFHCTGSYRVGGYNISCHKRGGHGTITFAEGLQHSCNPVMMQVAERIGSERFYDYVEAFGYLKKTGIDLPAEAVGIFHDKDSIGSTELATASFGQRFKVSPIAQLSAIASVANGGYSITPHIFSHATDSSGKIVQSYEESEKTQIIPTDVCETLWEILEGGVSGGAGAKNAYVSGYEIAAKTGTSEKFDVLDSNGNSYLRIGSCVAFAPADRPEIAVIIIVDEPTSQNKYGSVTAAPYIAGFMQNILPYLGYEPSYLSGEETVTLDNYEKKSVSEAKEMLKSTGISYEVIGTGDVVLRQIPDAGTRLYTKSGVLLLYTEESRSTDTLVPQLTGKTVSEANALLMSRELNIAFAGAGLSIESGAIIIAQSIDPGISVEKGTLITVTARYLDETD